MDIFTQFYPQLVSSLPMKDVQFTAYLKQKDLFSGNTKSKVKSEPTPQEGAEYFLDNVIEPPLKNDNTGPFKDMLSAMEEFNSKPLQELASTIRQKLEGGAIGNSSASGGVASTGGSATGQ